MNQRSLNDWLAFVEASHPQNEIELGLSRMQTMLKALDIHFDCPVITVAGTNGKGSTCAMLEAIYRANGFKTALHTSPHLLRFTERAKINNVEVNEAALVASFERVNKAREAMPLTYFEFTALAILDLFMREKPDVVILEVGLGGRLDAINALNPSAAIVTSVGVDHEAFLGNTREAIAWEKAHVYRADKPAVCADPNPPHKLMEYAYKLGARVMLRGEHFQITQDGEHLRFTIRGQEAIQIVRPALQGVNQIDNVAGVLTLVASLKETLPVSLAAINQALSGVQLTARFERVADTPLTYLDVGHNPHAARVLAKNLQALGQKGKVRAVFGMLADKDMQEVIEIVREQIDAWYIAGLPGPRGAAAELLKDTMLKAGVEAERIGVCPSIALALDKAQHDSDPDDALIVFGSFVTVMQVLPQLKPSA